MKIAVRKQKRKSLAFRLTPDGAEVLMPHNVEADSPQVQHFIMEALARLPDNDEETPPLTRMQVQELVAHWRDRLNVMVTRLQIRTMKTKWGSVSTAGTLTLADELLALPYDLVEYVVVHELLHLKFPDHRKGWQVSMGMYISDWQEREHRLQGYIPKRDH